MSCIGRQYLITVILIYHREKCVSETASNPHCPFARTHNSIESITKVDLRFIWQRENPNWAAANATDYDVTVADMFGTFWLVARMTGVCVWFVAYSQCMHYSVVRPKPNFDFKLVLLLFSSLSWNRAHVATVTMAKLRQDMRSNYVNFCRLVVLTVEREWDRFYHIIRAVLCRMLLLRACFIWFLFSSSSFFVHIVSVCVCLFRDSRD